MKGSELADRVNVPDEFNVYDDEDWLNRVLTRSSPDESASNPSKAL